MTNENNNEKDEDGEVLSTDYNADVNNHDIIDDNKIVDETKYKNNNDKDEFEDSGKNTKFQLIKQVVNKCVNAFDKYLTLIKSKK